MYCENIPYSFNFDYDISELVNQFYGNPNEIVKPSHETQAIPAGKQSLVLNSEHGDSFSLKGSEKPEKKSMAALKSHSEAERRRRERINGHMAALRDFIPNSEKMEKAMLLAEVIDKVKQLRAKAKQASQGLNIPLDTDELEIKEVLPNNGSENIGHSFLLKASLCCNYRADLLSDVRQAITSLPLRILKSEVSTLGCRIKIALLITLDENHVEAKQVIVSRVRTALGNILDKVSAEAECDQELFYPQKRRRVIF